MRPHLSLMSLWCTFHMMTKEADVPMQTWITSVHDIGSHITELSSDVATKDIILTLTCGLSSTYESLISIALNSTDHSMLTIDYVVQWLLNEDKWQISSHLSSNGSTSAYVACACSTPAPHKTPTALVVCYNCKCTRHLKNNCPISTCKANAIQKKKEGSANVAKTENVAAEGVDDYIEIF
jgi:hypothetical protein